MVSQQRSVYISIHALREEGDPGGFWDALQPLAFLSTPSARRATIPPAHGSPSSTNFYPRPPRGGRLRRVIPGRQYKYISIHALREEGDIMTYFFVQLVVEFLSTPSARRATVFPEQTARNKEDFYPRPPRGGRLLRNQVGKPVHIFLSTPSARRATAKTERKPSAFVSLYTSLHKLQRGACKTNRKITPLLVQTAGIPVRSVRENHVRCLFALAGHQKISTLSCANSGCSPTCSTLVW